MSARKPSKPWRVYGARGLSADYQGERGAYAAAASIVRGGNRATIYHWENGGWVRREILEAEPVPRAHRGEAMSSGGYDGNGHWIWNDDEDECEGAPDSENTEGEKPDA